MGYEAFTDRTDRLARAVRDLYQHGLEDHASELLHNTGAGQAYIAEDTAHGALWREIDRYYAVHADDETEAQYYREAAVAEDLDAAFDAGAWAALTGQECDPDDVAHFYGGE